MYVSEVAAHSATTAFVHRPAIGWCRCLAAPMSAPRIGATRPAKYPSVAIFVSIRNDVVELLRRRRTVNVHR